MLFIPNEVKQHLCIVHHRMKVLRNLKHIYEVKNSVNVGFGFVRA
jgi:hypothetical protein